MSTHAKHDHVTDSERQRWIDAVHDLYPDEADFGGGVAASVVIDHVGTDRHRTTVMRNLRKADSLRTEWGTMPDSTNGGRRQGFVPEGASDG
jgi:hypothetical protein